MHILKRVKGHNLSRTSKAHRKLAYIFSWGPVPGLDQGLQLGSEIGCQSTVDMRSSEVKPHGVCIVNGGRPSNRHNLQEGKTQKEENMKKKDVPNS